jgi:hypothetical protein
MGRIDRHTQQMALFDIAENVGKRGVGHCKDVVAKAASAQAELGIDQIDEQTLVESANPLPGVDVEQHAGTDHKVDRLRVRLPEVVHDLPAGGKRVLQRAEGYDHTFVAGVETFRDGAPTGERPGRLLRGSATG